MINKLFLFFIISTFTFCAYSQNTLSDETKKYIEYHDSITVFKNALLIDSKGNATKPLQSIIISKGKIDWVGEDAKVIIPKKAIVIDLNVKTIMPGLVMLHEHMYISAHSIKPR
jgi:imidazolonepropionase-like amidohydrolase